MLKRVLEPGVLVGAGGGGVHSEGGFESDWLGEHRFRKGLVLKLERIDQINHVGDRCFQYPFCFGSSDRVSARHAIAEVCCVYIDTLCVPKLLTG